MSRRKQRWLARTFFVFLLGLGPIGIAYWLWTTPVHNVRSQWWPWGHMHNVLEGFLAAIAYPIGVALVGVAIVCGVVGIGWLFDTGIPRVCVELRALWEVAWHDE